MFGDDRPKDDIKERKTNSFDDFIMAGEHLIESRYTSSEHLGVEGGSNGGLLVAAVAMMRPGLFAAVSSQVPLTDIVRFHKFGMASRLVHEYGSPENADDLKRILEWSPYHNIESGEVYPHFLFTTAKQDTRVHPMHVRKMAARLQDENLEGDTFIYTEENAGHGPGTPIRKIVEEQTIINTFFAQKLGLEV
jgi:prolyl oligopeptidase